MPYSPYSRDVRYSQSGAFPIGVKWLLIVNSVIFILYFYGHNRNLGYELVFREFSLQPAAVKDSLAVWQLVTYLFLHDPKGFSHILFNMLSLWMFGSELERTWGTKRFLKYYFLCGAGAGLCVVLANAILPGGDMATRTIGASGAIYGLLLAFGVLFPDRTVLFFFLYPMKAKYMVMVHGVIVFLASTGGSDSGVSHLAHLGGMLVGLLVLRSWRARPDLLAGLRYRYQQWKLQRAKRKFQVYLKKTRAHDQDNWVN